MIYLFYGDLDLANFEAEEIIEKFEKKNPGQFEIRKINLEEEKIDNFLSQPVIPFFENREVILLFQGEKLNKKEIENLIQIYQQSKEKHLIILAEELKSQHPLLKPEFLKGFKEVKKIVFNENLLRKKIQAEFGKQGKQVSDKLSQALINLYGSNFSLIKQEIKKIALYFANQNKISSQELKLLLSEGTEDLNFKLFKALAKKDKQQVLRVLSKTVFHPSEVPAFLSRILSRLRLWLKVKAFAVEGVNNYQIIAKKLNLNPFYIRHLINESSNFSFQELEKALFEGLRLDYLIKTGKMGPSVVPVIFLEKIFQLSKTRAKAG